MSEHAADSASLRQGAPHGGTDERRRLEQGIAQIQRDARCVRRVASLATLFPALVVAGLAYGTILQEDFPYIGSPFFTKILCELGLASLICLVVLLGLLAVYRLKLSRLRKRHGQAGRLTIVTGPASPVSE